MAKPILILDPGHGGNDPGGGSNRHWIEKNMTLQISLYQYNRFRELGVPAAITRSEDATLPPEQRTRIVRDSGAAYCLSNHINAGGGDGAEIIHSIYEGKDLAERLAQELAREGQNVRRVFTRTLPDNPGRDYYYMHRETGSVNTMIIEYGFADSSGDDVRLLRDHWRTLAEAIVRGFCRHIGHAYSPPQNGSAANGRNPDRGQGVTDGMPQVQRSVEVVNEDGTVLASGFLIGDRAYVPIRELAEAMGFAITWNGQQAVLRREDE
ncbi:N-acetylmuramoyl-L-alanine amidase [Xylanibacillus composti]|uniref:MurNAc-LAA domain-containing protein n=1 Tax=Xylanibacillus composti TaxID=1572762 RepID=A0A8J4M395_9BACL|nr:N-acetylmuramoyl-L-alanine amidase [Xylanibacillus composti]MDT9724772.1 N-acetylmuramoyl-L-alanine amidase [Xylanibacillus composti]GIQ69875.1 hypothetical protein XYCOK13_26990 [Xylanibacillus composti]